METIKIALILIVFIWLIASYILGIIHIFDKDLNTFQEVIWAFVIWLLSPIFIIELIACTKELIEDNNHFIYDIFNEIEDVKSKKIERRPLMKKYTLKYKILPFDDLTELDMGTRGIARKLEVLCKTTKKGTRSKIKFDKGLN